MATNQSALHLTNDPTNPLLTTTLYDDNGNEIATWTSTNERMPSETYEVGEAMKWAIMPVDKYLEIRKEK